MAGGCENLVSARWLSLQIALKLVAFFFPLTSCGVNVDSTVSYNPVYYPYANTPAIFGISPRPNAQTGAYGFQLRYFVTNEELNFLGYNVYISLHPRTAENIIIAGGSDGPDGPYSPNGVLPSFMHARDRTQVGQMISQNIDFFIPAPARTPFYLCQRYYFRLTAYLSNQLESLPSAQIRGCATASGGPEEMCPARSSCAPQ